MRKIFLVSIVLFSMLGAETLFEIKDNSGDPVFSISDDGLRVFNLGDTLMVISASEIRANLSNSKDKGLSRSFSVTTSASKGDGNDLMRLTPDSTRFWISDAGAGFGVSSQTALKEKSVATNFLKVSNVNTQMREGVGGNQYTDFSPENIFLGLNSGISTVPAGETSGESNVFLGNLSGGVNVSGAANVFAGYKSGFSNYNGHKNCFIGQESGYKNYSGIENVFIGYQAGYNNYDGDRNVFLGYRSGVQNISGVRNVFIGYESGTSNGTGWGNTFVGEASGMSNTDGYGNSYFGRNSAASISTGDYNTVMGNESIAANQSGSFNSCYGAFSGKWNYSSGSSNSLFGYQAGYGVAVSSNTYSNNSYFGTQSGFSTTTGSDNSYFGYQSGYNNNTGTGNVFIGYQAGYNETGSELLYIDNSSTTQPLIYGDFDSDYVRFNADISVKNQTSLNHLDVTGQTDLNGGVNVIGDATITGTRASVIHPMGQTTNGLFIQSSYNSNTDSWHFYQSTVDNLTLWYNTTLRGTWDLTSGVYTSSSDKRFKKNIEELTKVMDKVMLLQPKRYNFISQKNNDGKYIGLIAQEVEKLFPEFVMYNEEADAYTMDYAGLSVVAIQAIKEQQEQIDKLKSEIEEIKNILNK
ncbi:MAG: tail fiber domain-containing protein [Candidatus Delongbacteria bacterium]|nr:tail fiber domain-containing protein [Candidatus Delongbacteria bacterium]